MRFTFVPLILLCGPALAHSADLPHVHATDVGSWLALSAALAAIAAAATLAHSQNKARKKPRDAAQDRGWK